METELRNNSTIYRYKFTEDFMNELFNFSKIHQYDDRKDFKEAWELWLVDNEEIVIDEEIRLINLGYVGDVRDKMFKSARYYFRKKNPIKQEPRQRRQYISVPKELLIAMDEHITNNDFDKDYQPKNAFNDFCKDNEDILSEAVLKIMDQNIDDDELIRDKIKKTYKNRYFILTNK